MCLSDRESISSMTKFYDGKPKICESYARSTAESYLEISEDIGETIEADRGQLCAPADVQVDDFSTAVPVAQLVEGSIGEMGRVGQAQILEEMAVPAEATKRLVGNFRVREIQVEQNMATGRDDFNRFVINGGTHAQIQILQILARANF